MYKSIVMMLLVSILPLDLSAYSFLSPYSYCGGDPVNYIDPDGNEICGVTKTDAALAVADFRSMFPGDEFDSFRNLIVQSGKKQNGKSFAPISDEALATALNGVTLNEDQQALVEMVVNTINSTDVHKVEYIKSKGNLSSSAAVVFAPKYDHKVFPISTILDANGGLPVVMIRNRFGDGATIPIVNGSYSLVFKDAFCRPVITGHEIIGHGRSLSLGRNDDMMQHVDAIQTENLIMRVMGIPAVNTGALHGPNAPNGAFPQYYALPSFR